MHRVPDPVCREQAMVQAKVQPAHTGIKDYWDYYSTMTTSFNKGKAEGKDEAKRESALRMKEKGYTVEDIAEITGLSEEEIKNL